MPYLKTILVAVSLVMLTPIVAAGCSAGNTPPINKIVDTQAAYTMAQSNKANPNFVILDVRTMEEFNSGHIANAAVVDIYLPDFKSKLSELDRNKKYLVYCRTARRSADALKIMKDLGFREAYDMAGGITKWKAEGLPVVMN